MALDVALQLRNIVVNVDNDILLQILFLKLLDSQVLVLSSDSKGGIFPIK